MNNAYCYSILMTYFCAFKIKSRMKIQLLFFGITSDFVGETTISYSIENTTTVENLKELLKADYPSLKNINEFAIAVNEEYANDNLIIKDGDVIAIIPPVSGG